MSTLPLTTTVRSIRAFARTREWISRQVSPTGQPRPTPRRSELDTLRGLGIALVVVLHASGNREAIQGTIYEYLCYSFDSIRLPMLTVVSGMAYGLRPVTLASWRSFARGKLRRLGLPLLTLTSLTVGLRMLGGHEAFGVQGEPATEPRRPSDAPLDRPRASHPSGLPELDPLGRGLGHVGPQRL